MTSVALGRLLCRMMRRRNVRDRYGELQMWESLNFERAVMRVSVYLVAAVIAVVCAFMNIIYGVQFSSRANMQWIISVSIALVSGA